MASKAVDRDRFEEALSLLEWAEVALQAPEEPGARQAQARALEILRAL